MIKKLISCFFLFLWTGIVLILFPFNHFWVNYNNHLNLLDVNKNNYLDIDEQIRSQNIKLSDYILNGIVDKTANTYGISHWKNWINSLTDHEWDPDDFHSYSESQSLFLYINEWGDFWNAPLHKRQAPKNFMLHSREIRGEDWKYLNQALIRGESPEYIIVYHGVEFMEVEFWDQLKQYVEQPNGYAWKNSIGKTIESYGFISATFAKNVAAGFTTGFNWRDGGNYLPLKEPTFFKIYIPKGAKGVGYVSGYSIAGYPPNEEAQVLFKKDSKYKIINWQKNGINNIFSLLYLG